MPQNPADSGAGQVRLFSQNLSPFRAESVGGLEDKSPFVPTLENAAILEPFRF